LPKDSTSRFSSFSKDSKLASFDMGIFYTKGIGDAIPPANQNFELPLSLPLA